jgi:hypothetical protein
MGSDSGVEEHRRLLVGLVVDLCVGGVALDQKLGRAVTNPIIDATHPPHQDQLTESHGTEGAPMAETSSNRYPLEPDDAQRMHRLTEEVRSRLLEMALIGARTVGAELRGSAHFKFVPLTAATREAAAAAGDWVEVDEVDGFEFCYGVQDGVPFAESPCGAH